MLNRKTSREQGKLGLSKLYSDLNVGDKVALLRDLSFKTSFPKRMQGKTGIITEKRGDGYVVDVYDGGKLKSLTAKKINLTKLSN